MTPRVSIARSFLVALLAACIGLAQTPQRPAVQVPSISITASVPPDVVVAPSELLLSITITNSSDREISVGCGNGPPIWTRFDFDIRDDENRAVPETPYGQRMHHAVLNGSCFGVFIKPGKALQTEVILNRIYDLARPGMYSVQVEMADPNTGVIVKSAVVALRVPGHAQPAHSSSQSFRITATALRGSVRAGWNVPIEIAVTNISAHTIRLAVWQRISRTTHYLIEAQEFSSGVEVRDSHGDLVRPTETGRALRTGEDVPDGYFIYVPVRPGEVWKETRVIGTISDIGAEGRYTATVVLTDPNSGPVSSSPITLVVTNADQRRREHSEAAPPFIVTIRSAAEAGPFNSDRDLPVQVCMTNISDREIKLDNSITMDYIEVWERNGDPVPLTENGSLIRRSFGQGSISNVHPIAPSESLCGSMALRGLYDFSRPGDYSVQVGRAGEPHTNPELRADVTLVKSNVITLSVIP